MRFICLVCGMMGLCLQLNAQNSAYLGLRGSYQISTANLTNTILGTSIPTRQVSGIATGVLFKYFPKPQLGLQWEANYSQKGFEQILTDTNEVFETSFDYLEFPFLMNIYLGKRRTQYFLNFGPYLAILLNEDTAGPQDSLSENLSYLYDEDRDRQSSFGLKIAAGIFRDFGFGGFQVDAHFTADISNFLDPNDLSVGIPDNSQNLVGGITIAYLIPIGKPFDIVE